jgi:hypothetical protein
MEELGVRGAARGTGGKQRLVDRLHIWNRCQPSHREYGRHRCTYGRLQEWQRAHMAKQAAMVRIVVRFFLRSQSQGLAQDDQTHQQQEKQCPPGGPPLADRTNAMVTRRYGFRLTDVPRLPKYPPAGHSATPPVRCTIWLPIRSVPLGPEQLWGSHG